MSLEVVRQIRRKLYPNIADNIAIPGMDVAFNITQHVARHLGYMVVKAKQGSENNFNGFTSDIIAKPDGFHVDVLGDTGNQNKPVWIEHTKPNEMAAIEPRVVPVDESIKDILVDTGNNNGGSTEPTTNEQDKKIKELQDRIKYLETFLSGEVAIISSKNGRYLCNDADDVVRGNREQLLGWERLRIVRAPKE